VDIKIDKYEWRELLVEIEKALPPSETLYDDASEEANNVDAYRADDIDVETIAQAALDALGLGRQAIG